MNSDLAAEPYHLRSKLKFDRFPQSLAPCTLIVAILGNGHVAAAVVNVFLVGGQSNALGRADPGTLPDNLKAPQSDIRFYEGSLTTLRPRSTEFGPEITFGRDMANYYAGSGEKVAILKYAAGGTNLYSQWKAGGTATTTGDGPLYQSFQSTINAGMLALKNATPGDTFVLKGMIWMQGESDAIAGESANYNANLTAFIADIRLTYGAALPFVVGGLSSGQTALNATYRNDVRTAQQSVAAANSKSVYLNTDTYSLKPDNLHWDTIGQQQLGSGFAITMQTLIPEPSSSALMAFSLLFLLTQRNKKQTK